MLLVGAGCLRGLSKKFQVDYSKLYKGQMSSLWDALKEHYEKEVKSTHLRTLLQDEKRNSALKIELPNLVFDFSHEKMLPSTIDHFAGLVKDSGLRDRIKAMYSGEKINKTENRAVLHVALRAKRDAEIKFEGKNIVPDVYDILDRISEFSEKVRGGEITGFSGKKLTDVLVIGIGGSYLGIEFIYEALRFHHDCAKNSEGRRLRFLANVDPNDFYRATQGLDPETTLVVVNSKTFTTAETMLNAKTVRNWVLEHYKKNGTVISNAEDEKKIIGRHMCAASTNLKETSTFGIDDSSVFGFWDWVGGRYSVTSAVGILPLSLHFGFKAMRDFLDGAGSIDTQFLETEDIRQNVPLMLGLLGFYRITIQGHSAKAILPYSQALCKFAPHIQQVDMESNGKRVSLDGETLTYETAVVNFGEPGTNGQHSFYQLIHQGRTIPCEFIGYIRPQTPVDISNEPVSNHDELMSNFFSQPDALACGKTVDELKAEKVPEKLWSHKFFPGDKPSCQFLFDELTPFSVGQLLAIYEHRTAVEGFLWDVNSFDQWGVELGKALAKEVRGFLSKNRKANENPSFEGHHFNSSTQTLLKAYTNKKA